jgi:hypothetical protein
MQDQTFKSLTQQDAHAVFLPLASVFFSDLVFNLDPLALAASPLGDGRDLNVFSGRASRGCQGRPELELLVLIERGLW